MFCLLRCLEFHLPTRGIPPRQFSVIQSLKFAKGNKRITQKWRQLWQVVVCRCSVPSVISSDRMAAFLKCRVQYERHAYGSNLHAFFGVFSPIIGHLIHVQCTLCEEKEDEPISGVQQCSAVFKIMQNVSTLQEFTACCLSRLDGRYTMTFN